MTFDAPHRLPVAELFQALADPSRLRIVALLRSMELSVGELAQVLCQSQPRVSRHVKILADSGLIDRHKEGSWVFLALTGGTRTAALVLLFDQCLDDQSRALLDADAVRLAAVRADRAEAAARYFAVHAEAWDSIRSLHVAESAVERAILAAMGAKETGRPLGTLIDIGTGTGRMIELHGPTASQALGVDRSSEMLRLARVKLDKAGIADASLRQADMYSLPLEAGSADSVIIHQVLHYALAPAAAIAEAARVLRPGGKLLVVDFAAHGREDLRIADAHLRLGFSDEAIASWFAAAGLESDLVEHLPGGELTVTLWRGCKPLVYDRKAA
ncbi:MAG: metalloregulator ArsR/SmtB family transcription factor [Sphingomicrobium sp.]